MNLNTFLDTAPVKYKLKLLKAFSKGITANEFVKSNFLKYLDFENHFLLMIDQWNDKTIYKVNGKTIDKTNFDTINKIASKFFKNDEFLLVIAPSEKTNRVEKNSSAHTITIDE